MKKCCALCISDRHLSQNLAPSLATEFGTCDYCNSKHQDLMDPRSLREVFELVAGIYRRHEEGENLAYWFKNDWRMFPTMDEANVSQLLGDIFEDGEIVRLSFTAPESSVEKIVRWSEFRHELMYSNRFFPESDIDLARLRDLLAFLVVESDAIAEQWFRCRIQQDPDSPIPTSEMGAPPADLVSFGRANPTGVPYLYIASNTLTAISEVRPHVGESVSIATLRTTENLTLADLRSPRLTVSPFVLADDREVALLRRDIEFLEHLALELTRPIRPRTAAIEYLPTQYLCEYVKKCGFDGVLYSSAVGDGMNSACFYPNKLSVDEVESHEITKVYVDSKPTNVAEPI